MQLSVILGHPYQESFNAAIAETVVKTLEENGHTVKFHDLYAEGFDPVMMGPELTGGSSGDELVMEHQQEIVEADGIIVIHPNWWGQPPAILKGWVDRILLKNIAYVYREDESEGRVPAGLLKAKTGLVFNTSNTPEERENRVFGDPLERLWKDCTFAFCGVKGFDRRMFRVIADSTPEDRAAWLEETKALVNRYFPK